MPGSQKNGWMSYLNGGTSQYNFSYNDGTPSELEPQPQPIPSSPPTPEKKKNVNTSPQPISEPINKKQSGGKRKSRRRHSQKKYRHSRRK